MQNSKLDIVNIQALTFRLIWKGSHSRANRYFGYFGCQIDRASVNLVEFVDTWDRPAVINSEHPIIANHQTYTLTHHVSNYLKAMVLSPCCSSSAILCACSSYPGQRSKQHRSKIASTPPRPSHANNTNQTSVSSRTQPTTFMMSSKTSD